jgi:hypothetical protein
MKASALFTFTLLATASAYGAEQLPVVLGNLMSSTVSALNSRTLSDDSRQPALGNLRKVRQGQDGAVASSEDDSGDDEESDNANDDDDSQEATTTQAVAPAAQPADDAAALADQVMSTEDEKPTAKPVAMAKPAAAGVVSAKVKKTKAASSQKANASTVVAAKQVSPVLQEAQRNRDAIKAEMDDFNNDDAFQAENDDLQKQVVQQTESSALGTLLIRMRAENRRYAEASYGPHLEERLRDANDHVSTLSGDNSTGHLSPYPGYIPEKDHVDEVQSWQTNANHRFAGLLLVLVFTQVAVYGMVSSEHLIIKKNTWSLVDQLAVQVMAVAMFMTMWHIFSRVAETRLLAYTVFTCLLFAVFVAGSLQFKNSPDLSRAWFGMGHWVVIKAKAAAIGLAYVQIAGDGIQGNFFMTIAILPALFALVYISHLIKGRTLKDTTWYDSEETGIAGGAFASCLNTFVMSLIDQLVPGRWQYVVQQVAWAVFASFLIAIVGTNRLQPRIVDATKQNKYWLARLYDFLLNTCALLPYMTIFGCKAARLESILDVRSRQGSQLVEAAVCSFWGFLTIIATGTIPALVAEAEDDDFDFVDLMLNFGGYLPGYVWGNLILSSIGDFSVGWDNQTPFQENVLENSIIIFLCLVCLPIYIFYLQPKVLRVMNKEYATASQSGVSGLSDDVKIKKEPTKDSKDLAGCSAIKKIIGR